MTLKQALNARVKLELGDRIITPRGWVRCDRVLLEGCEIGCVQTRRARRLTDVQTVAGFARVTGYDVDWLIAQARQGTRSRSAA